MTSCNLGLLIGAVGMGIICLWTLIVVIVLRAAWRILRK